MATLTFESCVVRGPVSNTERQRQFRERNPGYYGRLRRKRKAAVEALSAQLAAQEALQDAPAMAAAVAEPVAEPEVVEQPALAPATELEAVRELVIPMSWIIAQFQREPVEAKRAA